MTPLCPEAPKGVMALFEVHGMGWRLGGLLLLMMMGGCASQVPPHAVMPLQTVHKSHYRSLSECLFQALSADDAQVDYALFTCTRSAVVAQGGEPIRIEAAPEGAVVQASPGTAQRIASHLAKCTGGL